MLQGVELYNHSLSPVPNSFDMEHANIAQAPAAASLVLELHDMLHRQFTKPWSSAMKSDDGGSAAPPLRHAHARAGARASASPPSFGAPWETGAWSVRRVYVECAWSVE